MDKDSVRILLFFTPEAPQIAPKLPNIVHGRLPLFAFHDHWGPLAIFEQDIKAAAVAKVSLTDPLIGVWHALVHEPALPHARATVFLAIDFPEPPFHKFGSPGATAGLKPAVPS